MTDRTIEHLPKEIIEQRNQVVTATNLGRFWKPCPGTGEGYLCCGYQIITPATGCGMYCAYCILQEYHEYQHQVVYENFSDLEKEVHEGLAKRKGVVRFGTGEFGDSLYLEEKYGLSRKIAALLKPYPNTIVEFKTKCSTVEHLKNIKDPSKVIIGFSMNTLKAIAALERGTASLKERLEAARRCEEMGFWVAFHFDPMVWYPQWKEDYRYVVDRIFSTIKDPEKIAWWSVGGFRTIPSLKKRLRDYNLHLPLFSGEMILGNDGKLRYFRPVRVEFYSAMQDFIEAYSPSITLYLCMESPEVWRASGMVKRIPQGLPRYLDRRAEEMLQLNKEIH